MQREEIVDERCQMMRHALVLHIIKLKHAFVLHIIKLKYAFGLHIIKLQLAVVQYYWK